MNTITKGKWKWEEIVRIGNISILHKFNTGPDEPKDYGYEVVHWVKRKEWKTPDGRIIPAKEKLPSSEEWGDRGWSFTRNSHTDPLHSAWAKLASLLFPMRKTRKGT